MHPFGEPFRSATLCAGCRVEDSAEEVRPWGASLSAGGESARKQRKCTSR